MKIDRTKNIIKEKKAVEKSGGKKLSFQKMKLLVQVKLSIIT